MVCFKSKNFSNWMHAQKRGQKKTICYFPLFFGKFQQNECARGLKTDHLFYETKWPSYDNLAAVNSPVCNHFDHSYRNNCDLCGAVMCLQNLIFPVVDNNWMLGLLDPIINCSVVVPVSDSMRCRQAANHVKLVTILVYPNRLS